jgi:hypothetical protein
VSEREQVSDEVHTLLAPQRRLRASLAAFRRALEPNDRSAMELCLCEFELGQRRRIELELRVLQPVLARVPFAARDARRELELQYVQLRELTRHLAVRIASNAPLGEIMGFAENLDRRLAAHESELESVYYPAALAALSAEDRRALAGEPASPAQPN